MTQIDIIFYLAVGGTFLTIMFKKLYNIIEYSKLNVVEINSADKNISSAKIEEIIKKFLLYMNISDKEFKVNYESSDTYARIFTMLHRRKKEINIPKWVLPSVGYELDYLLASIWYNVKLFQKDKGIRRIQFFAHILPIFALFFYYLFFLVVMVVFIIQAFVLNQDDFKLSNWIFFSKYKIFELVTMLFYFLYLICEINSTKVKGLLETNYERNIVKFVDEELTGYKKDLTAARTYAVQFRKLNYDAFRLSPKTSHLKFFGPFVSL